ncbi:MAG: glycosyltransferase family 2 protein [Alistipes sp.]|nr:glycosyltransferase family 2 protein [Alistipes sp.]
MTCNPSPKISVVVPVYNTERYLPTCIESILNQNYRNFELILIDDGSTDKSADIIHDFKSRGGGKLSYSTSPIKGCRQPATKESKSQEENWYASATAMTAYHHPGYRILSIITRRASPCSVRGISNCRKIKQRLKRSSCPPATIRHRIISIFRRG